MEIERKFLLEDFPEKENLPLVLSASVYQAYLSAGTPSVRVRRFESGEEKQFILTVKGKGTLAREEIEIDLTEENYNRMTALLPIAPIHKDFRVYRLPNGEELECSWVDRGTKKQFCYAEVEFPTIEEANAFVPPSFLGREVTEEPYYAMSSYWRRKTLPEIG